MSQNDRKMYRGLALIVVIYTVLVGGIYLLTGEEPPLSVTVSAGIEEAARRMIREDMIRP